MNTFQPFSIVLTNEGLNADGSTNIIKTRDGFPIHTFPETLVLPKKCKIKWVNLTINEIPSEKELYVCIQELPNICYIGDGVSGRKIKGFLGLVNHLDTTSNVFSNFPYIHLRNTEPIPIPQMTLQIYTNNGKASNFASDLVFYDLTQGNPWTSTSTAVIKFVYLGAGQFEVRDNGDNRLYYTMYFFNPTEFTTSSGRSGYYDIDIDTPSATAGNIIFTVGSSQQYTPEAHTPVPVATIEEVSKYALELRVEQEKFNDN